MLEPHLKLEILKDTPSIADTIFTMKAAIN